MNKMFTFMRESGPARALIPIGIILIIFGIITFSISSKNQNYVQVESIVSNVKIAQEAYTDTDGNYVDATYDITVKYTVSDQEYYGELNGISKYNVGDKITIYYNPNNPSEITQTKSLILPLAIIAGGIAALVGGIVSAKKAVKRYKKMKEQEKGWSNE